MFYLFQFEFVTSGDGVFDIDAKFMGVRLEHVEVDIQVEHKQDVVSSHSHYVTRRHTLSHDVTYGNTQTRS